MKMPKSYWMGVACSSDHQRNNIRTWFSPLCDDMTVERAEILCDAETDREKKIRAFVVDKTGKRFVAVRTRGRNFTISLKAA